MIHTDDTKHSHYHNKDVLMAGLAGILAGAASITALALSDPDIRKKVGKRASDLKSNLQDWSVEKLHMVEHHTLNSVEKHEKVTREEREEDEPLEHVAIKN
jgi:hypothetical protein